MVTGNDAATPAPETQSPETQVEGQPEEQGIPEADIDWKARAESAEEQISRLTNTVKSEQGRRSDLQKQVTDISGLRTEMDEVRGELSTLPDILSAAIEMAASDDKEGAKERLSEVQEDARKKKTENVWRSKHDNRGNKMTTLLNEMEEGVKNDFSSRWRTALQTEFDKPVEERDVMVFDDLLLEAQDNLHNQQLAEKDEALAAKDKQIEAAKSNFEEEYDVHNVDTGRSSGRSGNSSFDSLRQSDKRKMGLDELQEHKQKVLDAMAREAPA